MTISKSNKVSSGKIILTILALFTIIGPYLADWNITHIYNPSWPPHAKFHNAQTMVLGTMLGFTTLYWLWLKKYFDTKQNFIETAFIVSLYWLAQFPAILFPGTKLVDVGINHVEMPIILGVELNQLIMNCIVIIPLLLLAVFLELRRLKMAI